MFWNWFKQNHCSCRIFNRFWTQNHSLIGPHWIRGSERLTRIGWSDHWLRGDKRLTRANELTNELTAQRSESEQEERLASENEALMSRAQVRARLTLGDGDFFLGGAFFLKRGVSESLKSEQTSVSSDVSSSLETTFFTLELGFFAKLFEPRHLGEASVFGNLFLESFCSFLRTTSQEKTVASKRRQS